MKLRLSFCSLALLFSFTSLVMCSFTRADQGTGPDMNTDPNGDIIEKRIFPYDHYYPTLFRATVLAQVGMPDSAPRAASGGAQASLDFGTGLISGEIGLAYLTARTNLALTDSSTGAYHAFTQMDHYVGVPLLLKVNYIERPRASISLKLGVMPIVDMKDTSKLNVGDSGGQTYNLKRSDTLAVIGFTGAAPMGDDTEFILDGSYNRGLTNLDGNKSYHKIIEVGLGVRFDL